LFSILEKFRNWFGLIWSYFEKVTKEIEIKKRKREEQKK
jgi:hypothetical protein